MKRSRFLLTAFLFLGATAGLNAETGNEILAKVENALTGPEDYEATAVMTLADTGGGRKETRELKIWIAGNNKRVIKFLSPAGIKGIGLLSVGENSMHLYLPAQNKIRMISGSVKNENFQGTDFSYNEMSSYEYRDDYSAVVQSEDADAWTLLLTKKPGSEREYEKLVMTVDKKDFVPRRIELFRNGAPAKILTISEVRTEGKYLVPTAIRMEDVAKKHYTEMTLQDLAFDQGLEGKDVFSKRFLKKRVQ
ncbi:MAG: outer membrane lipoprotein-sorting protein [Spirochaetales bacterium]|nr:outer membrane lipoprotein-sorting protein [Spirochaetales bacterium]